MLLSINPVLSLCASSVCYSSEACGTTRFGQEFRYKASQISDQPSRKRRDGLIRVLRVPEVLYSPWQSYCSALVVEDAVQNGYLVVPGAIRGLHLRLIRQKSANDSAGPVVVVMAQYSRTCRQPKFSFSQAAMGAASPLLRLTCSRPLTSFPPPTCDRLSLRWPYIAFFPAKFTLPIVPFPS